MDQDFNSDRAFRAELNAFLDGEVEVERRAEITEELAQCLMKPGEKYHPWIFANFEEALANAPQADQKMFWSCVIEAINSKLNDPIRNHLALEAMKFLVGNYWYALALSEARNRVNRSW